MSRKAVMPDGVRTPRSYHHNAFGARQVILVRMGRPFSLLGFLPLAFSLHLSGQSFTHTIGGPGAQDGVGALLLGSGFAVGVREFKDAGPHQGLVYTMSNTGGLVSSSPLGFDQNTFLQGLANAPNGEAFLFGSVLDPTEGRHHALVVKLDANGEEEWSHIQNEAATQQYLGAASLPDGGVILCGVAANDSDHDVLVARHDASGERLWEYVNATLTDAEAYGVAVDGNEIIVTGRQLTFSGHSDVLFLRLDLEGNLINSNTTGGALDEVGRAVVGLGNDTYVIGGWTDSFGTLDISSQSRKQHAYLLCMALNGDTLWTRTLGDTLFDHRAFALQRASNGDLLLAGERAEQGRSDAFYARWTVAGGSIWSRILDIDKEDRLVHLLPMSDGGFVGTGWSFGPFGRQLLFIRRSSEGY